MAPAHLLRQWREELAGQNSLESEVWNDVELVILTWIIHGSLNIIKYYKI